MICCTLTTTVGTGCPRMSGNAQPTTRCRHVRQYCQFQLHAHGVENCQAQKCVSWGTSAAARLHPPEDGSKDDGAAEVAHQACHGCSLVTRDLAPAALQQQPELPAARNPKQVAKHATCTHCGKVKTHCVTHTPVCDTQGYHHSKQRGPVYLPTSAATNIAGQRTGCAALTVNS